MSPGDIVRKLMDEFEYKKPVIFVERVKATNTTPPGAILELLFFWDETEENQVLASFFISASGCMVTLSIQYDLHGSHTYEVYSGSANPKKIAVSVINWLQDHYDTIPPVNHDEEEGRI